MIVSESGYMVETNFSTYKISLYIIGGISFFHIYGLVYRKFVIAHFI